MKKNLIALSIVIVLAIVAFWQIKTNSSKSTIKQELRDFAVSDTASITKIFLADKSGKELTLERKSNYEWTANGKYIARQDAINVLLATIKNVEVMSPVPKAAQENIIKSLASTAIKVEIYVKNELHKVYYVGGETQDQLGTYMLMSDHKTGQNSSVPFINFIPGFNGYLTGRYFTNENDWRARYIFRYNPDDIASVKVEYFQSDENSFEIFNNGNNSFEVKQLKTGELVKDCNLLAMKQYLSYYQNIQYEKLFPEATEELKDSVLRAGPFAKITVTDKKNTHNSLKLYYKPTNKNKVDLYGKPIKYDPDRLYTWTNNDKEFTVIQYFVFDKLMPTIKYFQTEPVI